LQYRALGRTGIRVSVLGFGAAPLGGVYGAIDEDEGIRAVRAALDLGVNIIDVAPHYGMTRAETVLGRALRGVDRDSYVLATRVGRYGEDAFDLSASPEAVMRNVDAALAPVDPELLGAIEGALAPVLSYAWINGRPEDNFVREP
jgi:aryl-alcohol dehydrogenase-like predicted oxidoreductase